MKMKIIKYKGFYQLAVADKDMNELYGCSQDNPIILAIMTNYIMTKYWKVKDFRLLENANGNVTSTFGDFDHQIYTPLNEIDSEQLKSKLTHYVEKDGKIIWSSFNGVLVNPHPIIDPNLSVYLKGMGDFCWTFREAQKQFSELKNFWENYNEKDLNNIEIENTYRQIDIFLHRMKMPTESTIKNKMK